MKLSHLLLGSLIALASFLTNHAQARGKYLPPAMEQARNGTEVIGITYLDRPEKALINDVIRSARFTNERNEPYLIGVARNGHVEYRARKDLKALSDDMMASLAETQICDLNRFGECVIFDKGLDGDLDFIVLGTQLLPDGTTEFLQGTFSRFYSMKLEHFNKSLKKITDKKKTIFTRATETY